MSPVESEIAQLPAGLSHWTGHGFGVYRQTPPLQRLIASIPLLVVVDRPNVNWADIPVNYSDRTEGPVGRDFVRANPNTFLLYYRLGRFCCIPLQLLGLWVVIKWASCEFGASGGIVAGTLYAFCPVLVSHGALITTDAAAAAMAVIASYSYRNYLRVPNAKYAAVAGLWLGLAVATKTTLIALVVVWIAFGVGMAIANRAKPHFVRSIFQTSLVIYWIAWTTFCGTYFFSGMWQSLSGVPLKSHPFQRLFADSIGPGANETRESWLRKIPIPLPMDFVVGLDTQISDFEGPAFQSYLRDSWSNQGWWWYYLYVLAVKLPVSTVILCLLGIVAALSTLFKSMGRALIFASGSAILILVSSQTGFSVHGRYVWPVLPFMYMSCGGVWEYLKGHPRMKMVVCLLLACSVFQVLLYSPHNLAFFSEAIGGAKNGANHLLDSNVSWGQDLLHLKDWCERHPEARPLLLATPFGVDAKLIGIPLARHEEMPIGADGWYAVDVNYLHGSGMPIRGYISVDETEQREFSRLLELWKSTEPFSRCGCSIHIFRLKSGVAPE